MPTTSASSPSAVRLVRNAAASSRNVLRSVSLEIRIAPAADGALGAPRLSVRQREIDTADSPDAPSSSCAVAMSARIGGSARTSAPVVGTIAEHARPARSRPRTAATRRARERHRARPRAPATAARCWARRSSARGPCGCPGELASAQPAASSNGSIPSNGTRRSARPAMPTSPSTTGAASESAIARRGRDRRCSSRLAAERQQAMGDRAADVAGRQLERARGAVVREAHADVDADAEADASDRKARAATDAEGRSAATRGAAAAHGRVLDARAADRQHARRRAPRLPRYASP